jgi:hypothetical protein
MWALYISNIARIKRAVLRIKPALGPVKVSYATKALVTEDRSKLPHTFSTKFSRRFAKNKVSIFSVPKLISFNSIYRRKLSVYKKSRKFVKFKRWKKNKFNTPIKQQIKHSLTFFRKISPTNNHSQTAKEIVLLKKRASFLRRVATLEGQALINNRTPLQFGFTKRTKKVTRLRSKRLIRATKKWSVKYHSIKIQPTPKRVPNKKFYSVKREAIYKRLEKHLTFTNQPKLVAKSHIKYEAILSRKLKTLQVFSTSLRKLNSLTKVTFSTNQGLLVNSSVYIKSRLTTKFQTTKNKSIYNKYRSTYWLKTGLVKKSYFTRALPIYQMHNSSSTTFTKKDFCKQNMPQKYLNNINYKQIYMTSLLRNTSDTKLQDIINYYTNNSGAQLPSLVRINDLTYQTQLYNIINAHSTKNIANFCDVSTRLTSKSTTVQPVDYVYSLNTTPQLPYLLNQWLHENNFIYPSRQSVNKTTYVLSRVPTYKMIPNSPVSADRFRGNMYKHLGILSDNNLLSKISRNTPLSKFSYLKFLTSFGRSLKTLNTQLILKRVEGKQNLLKRSKVSNLFFIKGKVARVFFKTLNYHLTVIKTALPKIVMHKKKSRYYNQNTSSTSRKSYIHRLYFSPQKTKTKYSNKRSYTRRKRRMRLRKKNINAFYKRNKSLTYRKNSALSDLVYYAKNRLTRNVKAMSDFKAIKSRRRKHFNKLNKNNNSVQNNSRNNLAVFRKKRSAIGNSTWSTRKAFEDLNISKAISSFTYHKSIYSQPQVLIATLSNTILLKSVIMMATPSFANSMENNSGINTLQYSVSRLISDHKTYNNLLPEAILDKKLSKTVLNSFKSTFFQENVISWYHNTLIRFIEDCTGKKILFQFYPFMSQDIDLDFIVRYKRWLPRMVFYERRLGHRFFLEEALHIIHLSFYLKDPKIMCSWLKAMILRISFWKTRSIFRFLKYLFFNYFQHVFSDLNVKGLKIRLKGKISAAGNSRKRTILYRIGKTSHSTTSLRVLNESTTINTFTGVMGFNIWIFY